MCPRPDQSELQQVCIGIEFNLDPISVQPSQKAHRKMGESLCALLNSNPLRSMQSVKMTLKFNPSLQGCCTHRKEAAHAEVHKVAELSGGACAARVDQECHLMRQLKCSRFKPHIAAWRDLQDEPKVNVDQVPRNIDEDVAVVAVLGLQQKACYCIPASHGLMCQSQGGTVG